MRWKSSFESGSRKPRGMFKGVPESTAAKHSKTVARLEPRSKQSLLRLHLFGNVRPDLLFSVQRNGPSGCG